MTSTGVRKHRHLLTRAVTGTCASLALALTAGIAPPASASDGDLPPGRRITAYVVKPGDTATGLAVRHHAWTDELISHNHLDAAGTLYVGQRIEIPVVVSALPDKKAKPNASPRTTPTTRSTRSAGAPSRAEVRHAIVRTARTLGVDPELALAVSWQESGWQMHHVSSANAIGAMQVLPSTGEWMSLYTSRPLALRDLQDNVTAGVMLLKVLDDHTSSVERQLAAYYQGLGAVQEHGIYPVSRPYVANVLALKRQLERGWNPA